MALSVNDIRHIAKLARLELSDKEIKQYRSELGGILRYIDELNKVNVKNIEPTTRLSGQRNRLRADVARPWDAAERDAALTAAAQRLEHQLIVKRVLE